MCVALTGVRFLNFMLVAKIAFNKKLLNAKWSNMRKSVLTTNKYVFIPFAINTFDFLAPSGGYRKFFSRGLVLKVLQF